MRQVYADQYIYLDLPDSRCRQVSQEVSVVEKNPWRVDDIVTSTSLPQYTIRKFVRSEELLAAAKRMVRTEKQVPYYYRSATQLLYVIALETGLKALWEIDNGRQADYTHDLSEIFAKLHPDRREKHRRWYDLIADHAGSSVSLDGPTPIWSRTSSTATTMARPQALWEARSSVVSWSGAMVL